MSDTAGQLARARRTYDASEMAAPRRLGNLVALDGMRHDAAELQPVDLDRVRQARQTLWSRIPLVHRTKLLELTGRVRDPRLLAPAQAWTWGSPCLLMCGPTAVGKSSAAALVALRLMAKGCESEWPRWNGIRWYGANQLVKAAREWPLGDGDCPDLRAASACELLILDDLGNEQDWQTTMFDLLQARYERGRLNIVTSGLQLELLLKRYGDAVLRRLVERDGKMGSIVDCWGAK
jgi:hypothetical protein